jgi:valyl-tRNA synthetase
MIMEKSFNPSAIESHWYPEWEKRGYFSESSPGERPGYCIQL